jgi:hypothetical protein
MLLETGWTFAASATTSPQQQIHQACGWLAGAVGCPWKEQIRKVQAEASKDRARNGALVQDLRVQLLRLEEEAKSLRQALRAMEAEGGLKDMYIQTLLSIKEEAEVQRLASHAAEVARLQGTLEEREIEIIDQQAENIALRRKNKEWEGRYAFLKYQMESEVVHLREQLATLGHEARTNESRILVLNQEKEQLSKLCSSMKQNILETESTILELRCPDARKADLGWKGLHTHSLPHQKHHQVHHNSQHRSLQNAIWEKEKQIADLNDRLTEYHRTLVKLISGGVNPTSRLPYDRQWDAMTIVPQGKAPLRPVTTPV